jgi:hypothetical protein
VKQVEVVTARQWHGKHVSAPMDTDATTEEDAVFSMRSVPRPNNKDQVQQEQQPSSRSVSQSVSHELQVSSGSSWLAIRNLHC